MVENVVGNRIFAGVITGARAQVREGVSLAKPLKENKFFPAMVTQMINVGEETGSVDKMLKKNCCFL